MSASQKTKTKTKNDLSPWAQATYEQNAAPIRDYTATPATPYNAQLAAGLDPLQQQAAGMAQANVGAGQNTLSQAIAAAQAAGGYSPQQVSAGQLSSANLSPYMNQYTDAVANDFLDGLNRSREMAITNTQGDFTKIGAFGGSREGVADSLTNEAFAKQAASGLNSIYSDAFRNAQQGAQFDINGALQASLANQGAGLAGAGLNLNAGSQLAGMAGQQQQMGQSDASLLNLFGTQAQQTNQAGLSAAYQEFLRQQQDAAAKAGLNLGLLGATPYPTWSNQTQTTTGNPGVLGYASALMNGASMFMPQPGAASAAGAGSAGGANLASAFAAFSDVRMKKDIEHVLTDGRGRNWYEFRYVWQDDDEPKRRGVMAQETLITDPHAVITDDPSGFLKVDYGALH